VICAELKLDLPLPAKKEQLRPYLYVHFMFKWKRQGLVNPDLFLAPYEESDKEIKVLEVYDEDVFIHTGDLGAPTYATQGSFRQLVIRDKGSHKIIGFPHKLVESPYHAYKLFSPDFKYFIDWSHSSDGY
jgi:hypothetical protein